MQVSSSGDIGDVVILLGLLRAIPNGPHKLFLRPNQETKAKTTEQAQTMLDLLKPLVDSQPYIEELRLIGPGDNAHWRSEDFRQAQYIPGSTLMDAHFNHLNVMFPEVGAMVKPKAPWNCKWLNVEPGPESKGKVILARSGRYRNGAFPWDKIVKKYAADVLFVGLPHEHREFCAHWGYVDFRPTKNMLEVAQLIAGSVMFIGNQSSPMAICEGLKHRSIQETSLDRPDCVYARANAQFVADGSVELEDLENGSIEKIPSRKESYRDIPIHTTPPDGWQYMGLKHLTFHGLIHLAKINGHGDGQELMAKLKEANASRCEDYFFGAQKRQSMGRAILAMRSAGIPVSA